MVRWLRWHFPPDTGFEIRVLAVWGRARYLSVTEAPHNTNCHTWVGKKHFCFFQTAETGNRTPNSGVKGSGANHYPRAPALSVTEALNNNEYLVLVRVFLLYQSVMMLSFILLWWYMSIAMVFCIYRYKQTIRRLCAACANKHGALSRCCINFVPLSMTVAQR